MRRVIGGALALRNICLRTQAQSAGTVELCAQAAICCSSKEGIQKKGSCAKGASDLGRGRVRPVANSRLAMACSAASPLSSAEAHCTIDALFCAALAPESASRARKSLMLDDSRCPVAQLVEGARVRALPSWFTHPRGMLWKGTNVHSAMCIPTGVPSWRHTIEPESPGWVLNPSPSRAGL